ncbi:2-amino-4-hydroxy-6-hydroxymethyldihydropteridine diphosphokinase [Sphingobium sp. 10 DY56-G10]|uniref:2-amino-4-hydroxy-6-hydroxymethyldihydropteridine pyrophosphokinase n=1 Tax=Sphingobium soli TaxID=1591116 RepID=A0ABS8GZR4_9SPHN|nr:MULTISPECIES: 2-amino-4-hydroxy-6-hydroxymethyldihydropteridine diphosphokinase [Sphingomonadaceae]EAT08266.1 2-amino-4-hydroxy-6-hydroxymethyldihydropteridine pyrophosphokinase [Sphingomonas sp. SKA58]MCC4231766.1 2-amino-4-hydroxy-6-hydroxymethyldihydropteridine diphosphokinase [Sphingobium soli]
MADTRPESRTHVYALALGSNRQLSARRTPPKLVEEAAALIGARMPVIAISPIFDTPPLGPSLRRFANAAMLVETPLPPPALLRMLQAIETQLGRRRHRRWGARSMDIDIILWSGGTWRERRLTVPHAAFCTRPFVLTPLSLIAPGWRDPRSGLAIRHLSARLKKAKPKRPTSG